MVVVIFLLACIIGMIDPIVAAGGILTGMLWRNHGVAAALVLAATIAGIAFLAVSSGIAFQDAPGQGAYRAVTQGISVLLWAGLAHLIAKSLRRAEKN